MLGTNKNASVWRLDKSTLTYSENISQIRHRFEPYYVRSEFKLKCQSVLFQLYCDKADIQVTDKIVDQSGRAFVVAGVPTYDDTLGSHLEITMRELNSSVHETVTRRRLEEVQTEFDPIFLTWVGSKEYVDTDIKVIIDPLMANKSAFIKMMDAGKLEEVDLVMSSALTDDIVKEDRITRGGIEYKILRIVPLPYINMV